MSLDSILTQSGLTQALSLDNRPIRSLGSEGFSPFRLAKDIPTLMLGALGWPAFDHACDWLDANLDAAEVRRHKL
jgi:hypothetical protein